MKLIFCLSLVALNCKTANAQKVKSSTTINAKFYRIVSGTIKNKTVYLSQTLNANQWVTLFKNPIPSEGQSFEDVNSDGFADVVLKYRFGKEIYIYNQVTKQFCAKIAVGYDGLEPFENYTNVFYSLYTTKYDYGFEAKLFIIKKTGVKLIASIIERSSEPTKKADALIYTKYISGKKPEILTITSVDAIKVKADSYTNNNDKHFTWSWFLEEIAGIL